MVKSSGKKCDDTVMLNALEYELLMAFFFAIDDINESPEFLPNITLGYHLFDTCGYNIKAISSVLKILTGNKRRVPNYSCMEGTEVAGFVGDTTLPPTIAVADILNMYQYTQISHRVTNLLLNDKEKFPNFYSTNLNSWVWYEMVIKFLKKFRWNWVGIITSIDGVEEAELQKLTKEMTRHGICIEFVIHLTDNEDTNRKNVQTIETSTTDFSNVTCTGTEPLAYRFSNKGDARFYYIYTAVYSLAYTLHNMKLSINKSGKYELREKLHRYMRIVHYKDLTEENITNERGELTTTFLFGNIVNSANLNGYVLSYLQNTILEANKIEDIPVKLYWKQDKIPQARCNHPCLPGSRKVLTRRNHVCCYQCVPCPEGEISNVKGKNTYEICYKCSDDQWPDERKVKCIPKTYEYLSYEMDVITQAFCIISLLCFVVTVFIMTLFILFRDTPIVKANNRTVSFILLTSILLSFLSVFLFLGRPVDITCMLRQISFGIFFSIAVSSVLAKTITVCIAFKASKPGSVWRKWVGEKISNSVVIISSSIQVLMCVIWLSVSPPYQEYDMHSYPWKIIIQCNEGSVIGFYSVLGYMGFLAAVSFVLAFMVRTLPDSFNEAKYITFSMLVFCNVWIAMIPAYLSSRGKYMVAVEVFAILTSSVGLLGCIFFPKCYIIILKPEKNTKKNILNKIRL
ncbi:vomeronasal type-2 receptor 26-like [Pyxicephalus adspersus]|uniref:vomeronasal type-2 receptor 26-like n=1 Tax=Pyxicephalus adspersus TaxID=30357 RepID=UPI003B5A3B0B